MSRLRQKNRFRRKGRKSRALAGYLFLMLLAILSILIFQGYRRFTGDIAATADQFMKQIVAGNRDGAAALLVSENQGLGELMSVFEEPGVEYAGIGSVRIDGLSKGRAEFRISSGESKLTFLLYLSRSGWEWRILKIPGAETVGAAFVQGESGSSLNLFWEGQQKDVRLPRPSGLEFGQVVRVRLVDNTAVFVEKMNELTLSRLIRRGAEEIEGELEGDLPSEELLPVYRVTDQGVVEQGNKGDLVIGREKITFYLREGVVAAAKVEEPYQPRRIRVVLRRSIDNLDKDGLQHSLLRLSGEKDLLLEDKIGGRSYIYEAGRSLLVEAAEGKIRVIPSSGEPLVFTHRIWFSAGEGRIIVSNLQRSGWEGDVPYRGTLDIVARGDHLLLVNEPTLEQYLYTVVPSEMPIKFGREPLKAQAVAARTYAYKNIFSGRFSEYGAHVDDSVLSQVYNNIPEQAISNEAVDDTAGMVLFYNGVAADARFFSTSPGHTANFHEVWHDPATGNFPSEQVPYLRAASQIPGKQFSLHTETQVREFLLRADWPAYDAEAPFFRWQIKMSAEELAASINNNLRHRFRQQPAFILTKEGDQFRSVEIPDNPLGELLGIEVIERGAGGNLMAVEVTGTRGAYRILKEYNIRFTLRPVQYLEGAFPVVLKRADGSTLNNNPILPSAFLFFDLQKNADGRLEDIVIYGGGNGHGVGMSQHGARGISLRGYDYSAILNHYYPGTVINNIYAYLKVPD